MAMGAGLGFPVGDSAALRFHPQPPIRKIKKSMKIKEKETLVNIQKRFEQTKTSTGVFLEQVCKKPNASPMTATHQRQIAHT